MARATDATLVTRAICGDAQAFEALISRYQKTAHAIARALRVPASNLDDVVQESFLSAFRDLGDLRDRSRFLPWFLAIVKNCALRSHRRREHSRVEASSDEQRAASPHLRQIS